MPTLQPISSVRSLRSIAVLLVGRLGDTVLSTPLLGALRVACPGAEIVAVVAPDNARIVTGHESVDRVVELPRGWLMYPAAIRLLRTESFDLYIDFKDHPSSTSRWIARIVRSPIVLTHVTNRIRSSRWRPIPTPGGSHFVDAALAPMRFLCPGEKYSRRPAISPALESLRRIDPQMVPGSEGIVAVNISAGNPSRYWGLKNWEMLVDRLAQRLSVVVLAAPEDRDKADVICSMRHNARPVRTENLLDVAAVLSRCRLVVTADTSIVHVASATDTPCVALYPPNAENLERFAPLSTAHIVVMPEPGHPISSIQVDEIARASADLLKLSV